MQFTAIDTKHATLSASAVNEPKLKHTEEKCSFLSLPTEIIHHILTYLDCRSLSACAKTCSIVNREITSTQLLPLRFASENYPYPISTKAFSVERYEDSLRDWMTQFPNSACRIKALDDCLTHRQFSRLLLYHLTQLFKNSANIELKLHQECKTNRVAFSPTGKFIIQNTGACGITVTSSICKTATNVEGSEDFTAIVFNPKETFALACTHDKKPILLKQQGDQYIIQKALPLPGDNLLNVFSTTEDYALIAQTKQNSRSTIHIYSLSQTEAVLTQSINIDSLINRIQSHPDKARFAATTLNNQLYCINHKDNKFHAHNLFKFNSRIIDLLMDNYGSFYLIRTFDEYTLTIINSHTFAFKSWPRHDSLIQPFIDPHFNKLITILNDSNSPYYSTLFIQFVKNGKICRRIGECTSTQKNYAASPVHRVRAILRQDASLKLWGIGATTSAINLPDNTQTIQFSPDGQFLLATHRSNTATVYRVAAAPNPNNE